MMSSYTWIPIIVEPRVYGISKSQPQTFVQHSFKCGFIFETYVADLSDLL